MQLKIWHKMMVGIAIPSCIALLGGLLTYGYISDINSRQGFVQIADDLKELVLEIRRNEKNFFHYKNAQYAENLKDAISILTTSINSVPPNTIKEIDKEDFLLLDKDIQKYSELIDNLYENYQRENKVTKKVRTEGRKLETFVSKGKHAADLSTSFVLHLRLMEKNYMLFRDKKSYNELNIAFSELKDVTPFCYECEHYVNAVRELFVVYEESDSMINNLQAKGKKLEEVTGKIATREREKIGSFLKYTQILLLIALALLCTLGPLFVYKTSSYIVAPIKRLAEITRRISGGEITLRAPLKEHDETYALAASFNTMIDDLQWTQESLAESLERFHEQQAQLVEAKKLSSLGILTAGVAHELTNPLNNISMIAQTYAELYDKLGRKERIEFMDKVDGETIRIKEIIKNLLDFSKPKEAKLEEADINTVLKKSLKLVQNMLDVSNIDTKLNLEDGLPYIFIDKHQIQQVFVNLIINAIQAMSGGGVLSVVTRPGQNKDFIKIDIQDTGKGISPEFLPHIFDPFFSTKGVDGTGLGLSISYGIIKSNNGNIGVESKVGNGTIFSIELPVYKGKEGKDEQPV